MVSAWAGNGAEIGVRKGRLRAFRNAFGGSWGTFGVRFGARTNVFSCGFSGLFAPGVVRFWGFRVVSVFLP
jgi:hypothetical protein